MSDVVRLTTPEEFERETVIEPPPGLMPATIETVGIDDIFQPLPPIQWTVEGLKIAPGPPTMLSGYGYSGKTLLGQEIAACVATGKRLFDGELSCTKGRALHVDFEQGRRVTFERYQRLLRGKKVEPESIGDTLRVAVLPHYYLDSSAAYDIYKRLIDGFTFVLIDSLRASAPSLDENSSEFRKTLDVLGRIAEETSATIAVIHHSGKGNDSDKPKKMAPRGSSAIFDACGSVYALDAEKGEPSIVTHTKCRHTGTEIDTFGFKVEDVRIGDDPRGGVVLKRLGPEQLALHREEKKAHEAERSQRHTKQNGKHAGSIPSSKSGLMGFDE
jgi:RecA-family ATPase